MIEGIISNRKLGAIVIAVAALFIATASAILFGLWLANAPAVSEPEVHQPSQESLELHKALSELEGRMQDYMVSVFAAEMVLRKHGKEVEELINLVQYVEELYEFGIPEPPDNCPDEDDEEDETTIDEGGDSIVSETEAS